MGYRIKLLFRTVDLMRMLRSILYRRRGDVPDKLKWYRPLQFDSATGVFLNREHELMKASEMRKEVQNHSDRGFWHILL